MCASSTPQCESLVKMNSQDLEEFKKPNGSISVKKAKPKILTEEKYVEEMAKIIQRDFFPDLEKLKAQNDYLDAMERKDYAQMEAIRAKYSGKTPLRRSSHNTPATFETPASLASRTPKDGSINSQSSKRYHFFETNEKNTDKSMEHHSLDSFLQSYTSEDNYSFQEIIEAAEEKLKQKFAVLYSEENNSAEKLAKALTLPSIEKQFEERKNLKMQPIETWSYTNKNSIMYIPEGVELTVEERIDMTNKKQKIQHNATRLSHNPFDESGSQRRISEIARNQSHIHSDKVGPDGLAANPVATKIRGFNLVKTPSPRPGEAFSPLMTWGEIEGTPFRLDGSDTPVRSNVGPSFKINETSRRESIALALAEQIGEKMRAQKQRAMDTARKNIASPFIRSNMERLSSMSPAARRLATTKLGLRTPLITTPSPTRTNATKPSPNNHLAKKSLKFVNTNGMSLSHPKQSIANNEKSTLTDDLLRIPTKRLRAADFF